MRRRHDGGADVRGVPQTPRGKGGAVVPRGSSARSRPRGLRGGPGPLPALPCDPVRYGTAGHEARRRGGRPDGRTVRRRVNPSPEGDLSVLEDRAGRLGDPREREVATAAVVLLPEFEEDEPVAERHQARQREPLREPARIRRVEEQAEDGEGQEGRAPDQEQVEPVERPQPLGRQEEHARVPDDDRAEDDRQKGEQDPAAEQEEEPRLRDVPPEENDYTDDEADDREEVEGAHRPGLRRGLVQRDPAEQVDEDPEDREDERQEGERDPHEDRRVAARRDDEVAGDEQAGGGEEEPAAGAEQLTRGEEDPHRFRFQVLGRRPRVQGGSLRNVLGPSDYRVLLHSSGPPSGSAKIRHGFLYPTPPRALDRLPPADL